MQLCCSMALPLCSVLCNYSSIAKDSPSPWVKGVPTGAPGPSRRGFGLCGCNYAYSSGFHFAWAAVYLVQSEWVASDSKEEGQSQRDWGGAAALHTASTVLAFKWATPGQVDIYEFLQHTHPPHPTSNLRLNFNWCCHTVNCVCYFEKKISYYSCHTW